MRKGRAMLVNSAFRGRAFSGNPAINSNQGWCWT